MTGDEARERLPAPGSRVLPPSTRTAAAHVPVTFALQEDTVYSVTDAKPKRTTALRR